jgi:hypothetical protein
MNRRVKEIIVAIAVVLIFAFVVIALSKCDGRHEGFMHGGVTIERQYPREWFVPINDPHKPDWEILPQEANPGEVILSKRNELGLLSNFAPTPFVYHDRKYASLEGFWQMMLYPEGPDDPRAKAKSIEWKFTRDQVAQMTAFDAKAAGTLAEENMKKKALTG